MSLGLIAGEALTNALKHAFADGRAGRVRVGLRAAARREGSLGLRLIETLAKQVKGRAAVGSGPGGAGTVVAVTFPAPDGGSG